MNSIKKKSKPKYRKDPAPELGKNAADFAKHLDIGFDVAGLEMSDYRALIIQDERYGPGFSICQLDTNEHEPECYFQTGIAVFEDGIHWMVDLIEKEQAHGVSLVFNEKVTGSMAAMMVMTCILREEPLYAPTCPCCEEEANQ